MLHLVLKNCLDIAEKGQRGVLEVGIQDVFIRRCDGRIILGVIQVLLSILQVLFLRGQLPGDVERIWRPKIQLVQLVHMLFKLFHVVLQMTLDFLERFLLFATVLNIFHPFVQLFLELNRGRVSVSTLVGWAWVLSHLIHSFLPIGFEDLLPPLPLLNPRASKLILALPARLVLLSVFLLFFFGLVELIEPRFGLQKLFDLGVGVPIPIFVAIFRVRVCVWLVEGVFLGAQPEVLGLVPRRGLLPKGILDCQLLR